MKKRIALFFALFCVLGLAGCDNKSLNYIIENKPNVTGIVEEVYDGYIIVYSETAEGYPNGSHWSISLNTENKDSYTEVVVGDEIVFYYDGMAMETDPLQVSTVYAITLKTPADRTQEELSDLIPMVMVNGELYLDTGKESTVEARCGMMDGEITSEVDGTKRPTKDNESNFGTGYGYQYGPQEGTIEIYMHDKWWIFATEEVRQQIQFSTEEIINYNGKEYKKSELCDATLQWLKLSEQERMLSSYMPPEFMIFEETWGITLTAENITPTGATIKCTQSGGEPTGELHTGSWFILENWTQQNGWKEVPYVVEGDVAWTEEAWMISKGETYEWDINWEYLYGTLAEGKYRIGKEIMDFRVTGDYDTAIYFAEFEITK